MERSAEKFTDRWQRAMPTCGDQLTQGDTETDVEMRRLIDSTQRLTVVAAYWH